LDVDLLVEGELILELNRADKLAGIDEAQLPTCIRRSHVMTGLLINFNVIKLKEGIKCNSFARPDCLLTFGIASSLITDSAKENECKTQPLVHDRGFDLAPVARGQFPRDASA
jgi:hypothetical protein